MHCNQSQAPEICVFVLPWVHFVCWGEEARAENHRGGLRVLWPPVTTMQSGCDIRHTNPKMLSFYMFPDFRLRCMSHL